MAPVVAIPTTAGTGSEVGRTSVITDPVARVKRPIFHLKMTPAVALLDAALTSDLPQGLTAATGMDALTHLIEAFCTTLYHPMAVGIAMEGIGIVGKSLPVAYADGKNISAREDMLVASMMGAVAFQRGLGAVHAIAQPLGALYDAHHGLLNAILLPYVLKANEPMISTRIERLSCFLELQNPGFSSFLDWILRFRSELNIPHSLRQIMIDTTDAELIGNMAVMDCCSETNPIAFTSDDYQKISRRKYDV
jgi:alcohol dehydrogenase class IV